MFFVLNSTMFATIYLAGFLISSLPSNNPWKIARLTALVALLMSTLVPAVQWSMQLSSPPMLTVIMGVLVSLLGWVIINYSARYLQGEQRQALFVRAMLFTLASVTVLVVSRNLLVIALAWSGTSIGLHYLLTYYRDRKAAQIVAHKKFIVSRISELCLIGALTLIYSATDTLSLDDLNQQLGAMDSLPIALHISAVLLVMAAILKSAQLPLHGWLIQVMEAPTPVSALLHAGVVNIGGFVLISLAALIGMAPVAQVILVVVGSLTAVLAGWAMMTRISIKVRLAWSTCAQMGFMLMEIGLGLYELALLHLVAHSIYKAYAFLAAGDAVEDAILKDYMPRRTDIKGGLSAVIITTGLVVVTLTVWQLFFETLSLPLAAAVVLVLGLAPLLWRENTFSAKLFSLGVLRILALCHFYLLWHWLFASIAPEQSAASDLMLIWVVLSFSLLYAAQVAVYCYTTNPLVQRVYPWAYNGFYLDETFTRLTFKVWPARLSPVQAQTQANRQATISGETE